MKPNSPILTNQIWLKASLLKQIQLEGFKSRQSIWSALIAYEQDGILVTLPELAQYKGAWRPLVSPKDYQQISLGKMFLWWRLIEKKSIQLCVARVEPSVSFSQKSLNEHAQIDSKSLIQVNPLKYWVRSPEQASLRRALITEQEHALCLTAPRGSGMTMALTSAICDWLDAQVGECIFVTRSPRKAKVMLQALSSNAHRVHLLKPQELSSVLLNQKISQDESSQHSHLSLLEEGSILADALSNKEWTQWSSWAQEQKSELGPWLDWIGALRRLILKRVVVLGSPSTNPSSVRERLKDLPENWLMGLANLGQQLWESEHLEYLRGLEEVSTVTWPWPKARALVIDDCLSLPWSLIYKTLKFADEHLGVSGRKWSLMLASSGEGGQSVTGVRLDEIETLVSGVLGRHIMPLSLNYSERLPKQKILGVRDLVQEQLKTKTQQIALQLPSSLHVSQVQKTNIQHPLWHIKHPDFNDSQQLKKLFEACVATPGAFILDLSPRPQASLYEKMKGKNYISEQMLQCIISPHDLEDREVQWLIAYRGSHSQTKQALIPEILNHLEETDFYGLYYLLTRSPTPLIWLGDFNLNIKTEEYTLDQVLTHISVHSPWQGLKLFQTYEQALKLYEQKNLDQSLQYLEGIAEAAKQVFDVKQLKKYNEILSNIYHQKLSISAQQADWMTVDQYLNALSCLRSTQEVTESIDQSNQKNEGFTYLSVEVVPSKSAEILMNSLSTLVTEGETGFRSQDLKQVEQVIQQFAQIMRLSIASLCHQQIKETCWLWSERILSLPVPQASLQYALIELLEWSSPNSIEYQCLKPAYEHKPSALALTQIADQVINLDSPSSEKEQQRRVWTYKHLQRWIAYLLEPRAQSPLPHLALSTVAIGFALVAAKEKAWSLSKKLADKSFELNTPTALDPKWSIELTPADEHKIEDDFRRRQWKAEWQTYFAESSLSEQVQELRQKGDFTGTIAWYQRQKASLPHELKVIDSLTRHLDELGKFWHSLSPSERATLEQMWTQMKEKGEKHV